eukprot:scaffold402806_cov28-Prasinocladus_malaysianus.AAC.2
MHWAYTLTKVERKWQRAASVHPFRGDNASVGGDEPAEKHGGRDRHNGGDKHPADGIRKGLAGGRGHPTQPG